MNTDNPPQTQNDPSFENSACSDQQPQASPERYRCQNNNVALIKTTNSVNYRDGSSQI